MEPLVGPVHRLFWATEFYSGRHVVLLNRVFRLEFWRGPSRVVSDSPAPMKAPGIKRALHLGLLSKDFAQLRLSGKAEGRSLDRIVDRLGRMHGLPQKIGQILSFRELTEDAGRFTRLTEDVSGLGPEEALAEMARQIGACESENSDAGQPSG